MRGSSVAVYLAQGLTCGLLLSGCGMVGPDDDGADTSSTTPATTTTVTTAAPTTPTTTGNTTGTTTAHTTATPPGFEPGPEPGSSAQVMAEWLNKQYKGFDKEDPKSPLGVTISMQKEFVMFCKEAGTDCYEGHADCRYSASLYNHKIMLDRKKNAVKITMDRCSGIVFNQSLVQTSMGKCSFQFDGASFNRYNGACGCSSVTTDCDNEESAYGNVCPSTGKTCKVTDKEIANCACDIKDEEPTETTDLQCYWKGAGFDGGNVQWSEDQTRKMVLQRLRHQEESNDDPNDKLEYWNEVVIDEHIMLDHLRQDSAPVISAFVYVKGCPGGVAAAQEMRKDYTSQFKVPVTIPIVAVDNEVDVSTADGPFFVENAEVVV